MLLHRLLRACWLLLGMLLHAAGRTCWLQRCLGRRCCARPRLLLLPRRPQRRGQLGCWPWPRCCCWCCVRAGFEHCCNAKVGDGGRDIRLRRAPAAQPRRSACGAARRICCPRSAARQATARRRLRQLHAGAGSRGAAQAIQAAAGQLGGGTVRPAAPVGQRGVHRQRLLIVGCSMWQGRRWLSIWVKHGGVSQQSC